MGKETYDVPELLCAALEYLEAEIERLYWNKNQEEWNSCFRNNVGEFKGKTFTVQAYDWSEPDEPEPNFEWRGVKIWWYKYLGRGTYANKELTPDMIDEMLNDCLNNISIK